MDSFSIHGPTTLRGTVVASGAKNAALPALAGALLCDGTARLRNVPRVQDVRTMARVLDHLGASVETDASHEEASAVMTIDGSTLRDDRDAPYELVKTMRASVLVLGPLLARCGRARVSLPGGCAIGERPIDQHLAGLEAMGATIRVEHGYVEARSDRLVGATFRFAMPTVTGTENLVMAATLARGTTVLENCALEPEIVDLCDFLLAMGARIEGAGTSRIEIEGSERLHGAEHTVCGDRIEAGTYLIGGVMTGGDVEVCGVDPAALQPLIERLRASGGQVVEGDDRVRAMAGESLRASDVITAPHPGFATDLQAQFLALLTQAQGRSNVVETVFENRFQHVPELRRMGARIDVHGNTARVDGPVTLSGARVMATDLRASASLVLAGLVAEGITKVDRIYHLDRGYQGMESKLQNLGARVQRIRSQPDG